MWNVGGRLGYLINNNTLLYALGGYTEVALNGQIDLTYSNIVTGPQVLSVKAPDELSGYFIGPAVRSAWRKTSFFGSSTATRTTAVIEQRRC